MQSLQCSITDAIIDPAAVLAGTSSDNDGAVVLFLGVVRDHNDDRAVSHLEYEAYTAMAEAELRKVGQEARDRFDVGTVRIVHRIGRLEIGEVSVAISVASPHRAAAYESSRYIIEELKKRVPIWKREGYLEGERVWLAGGTK
ncbi:MAG TPA: molybdenum cofactor biosynthesis protein MoaE [Longimicrobiaceae bacterium]|nr:molybdenum cofactor biosynthesis protein MoaE [Longimicrobiaceae bacterium]